VIDVERARVGALSAAGFPAVRPRRLRRTAALRRMVQETTLSPSDVIYPMFVRPGRDLCVPIRSMPP
jgi:porphobilinogen synthase